MLVDIGDALFRILMAYLFRDNTDQNVEISINSSPLQESFGMLLPDTTHLLVKSFYHKNYLQNDVFRLEVYRTRPGDLRGNRVAFFEIPTNDSKLNDLKSFAESVLAQCGL